MAVRILPFGLAQGGQATRTVLVGASKARRGSHCWGESAGSWCSMHLALQSQRGARLQLEGGYGAPRREARHERPRFVN